jgi:hypothetical protein
VLAAVALGSGTVESIALAAGVDTKPAVVALERLAAAGVVVDSGAGLMVAVNVFREAARRASEDRRAREREAFTDVEAAAAPILRAFVREGRLERLPASRAKRIVVLDWIAGRFEAGTKYPEREVNRILDEVHSDVAALRRNLVDEGFLERQNGVYWRAPGHETASPSH